MNKTMKTEAMEYREKRVAKFMADGLGYSEIGRNLSLHPSTVRTIAIKLGLHAEIRRRIAK